MIVNRFGVVEELTCPSFQSPQKKLRKNQVVLVDVRCVVESIKVVTVLAGKKG